VDLLDFLEELLEEIIHFMELTQMETGGVHQKLMGQMLGIDI
jgi:hypothetical protein